MANGKRYIGSSGDLKGRRRTHFSELRTGIHGSPHMQNAFNLYGEENFVFTVLYECQPQELERCEQEEIDVLKPEYNHRLIVNTNRGLKNSEETRRKLSIALKGRVSPNRGKKFSEEWCKHLSESHKGYKYSDERKLAVSIRQTGKKYNRISKTLSEETKRKMSESHKRFWAIKRGELCHRHFSVEFNIPGGIQLQQG